MFRCGNIKVDDAVNLHCFKVFYFLSTLCLFVCVCVCVCVCVHVCVRPGWVSFLLAPRGWRLHAWVKITCAGALCGLFMNQLFCSDFSLHLCLFRTGPYTWGGREGLKECGGRRASASHTSPWTPHLNVTHRVFITLVYLHGDKASCYGCGMKTGWRARQTGVEEVT